MHRSGQAKQPDLAGADGGGRQEAVPGTQAPRLCGPQATNQGISPKPAGKLQRGVRVCGADPRAGL